jgi:hypothetical protein
VYYDPTGSGSGIFGGHINITSTVYINRTTNSIPGTYTQTQVNNMRIYIDSTMDVPGDDIYVDYIKMGINRTVSVNYQLDLEVQFIEANYTQDKEEICVLTGSQNTEALHLDVWTGSDWVTLDDNLTADGWNNISVSTYLTSDTLTFRFKGDDETNDAVNTSWEIDAVFLHCWNFTYQFQWEHQCWEVVSGSYDYNISVYGYIIGIDWWDNNWNYRRKLTLNNTDQSEDLINFPLFVNLSASNFDYAKAKSDGTDLRFIDADGETVLKYHIEKWDTTGNSSVWVNVTRIDKSSSTDYIWMYYNNSDATDVRDSAGTYNTTYIAVWHLNETSGIHYDATSNDNDGFPIGGVEQNSVGKIDGADDFDGTDDSVNCSDSASFDVTTGITIEAWVWIENDDHTDLDISVLYKYNTSEKSYALTVNDDAGAGDDWDFYLSSDGSADTNAHASGAVNNMVWQHVVATWQTGSDMVIYVDGTSVITEPFTGPIYQGTTNPCIGDGVLYGSWEGIIDELSISDMGRSSEWVAAKYLSMKDEFITYGSEETPDVENITIQVWSGSGWDDLDINITTAFQWYNVSISSSYIISDEITWQYVDTNTSDDWLNTSLNIY